MNNWIVKENGFNRENIVHFGNKFMTGNGYMGYRGTLEEYQQKELVACNIAGLYDKQGDSWREPINAPNGLYTKVIVGNEELNITKIVSSKHSQSLHIGKGIHQRNTIFETEYGNVEIESERFLSLKNVHLMCMKYTVRVENSCDVTIKTGIDGEVWDINGPHLEDNRIENESGVLKIVSNTQELKIPVVVGEACHKNFRGEEYVQDSKKTIVRNISFRAKPEKEYTLYKYVTVFTGNDGADNIEETCSDETITASKKGYEVLFQEHKECWKDRWTNSDIIIEGNDEDQLALRYSMYHLHIIAPFHSDKLSIPARGLSGQTYKGAVFWDTEIFMMPFFLYTSPEVAKNLINYRIRTLDGARKKAQEYGFKGAFYAWESHENGEDACSDFNVTDVFTGRPVKTYFKDKQIHISSAVVHAIWETYRFTGDIEVLLHGGAEVILECSRFYYSYAYYKESKKRYEILDVIGPDEYHERVNNSAYTNKMVYHTLDIAVKTLELLQQEHPVEYDELIGKLNYKEDIFNTYKMKSDLYVPEPNEDTGIIEQFDGYKRLEECSVEQVRGRLLNPKEYWGGGNGVASNTQVIKQADVALMLYLFRDQYSQDIKKKNWEYYEPRTEHGSSLSPCIYSLLSCDIGNPEWAYPFFRKTANVDLTGKTKQFAGDIYIGGTHPAANGGAWMAAVQGFAGLRVEEGKVSIKPNLPKSWDRICFNVMVRGEKYRVDITKGEHSVVKI